MAQKIIYTQDDGGMCIVTPSPNWKGTIQALAAKDVPAGRTYQIIEDTEIPKDRTYRNAWKEGKKAIDIDMPKARNIFLDNVRVLRNAKLAELDVEVVKKVERGESMAELAMEKQRLRDLPATLSVELEKCKSVEDFENIKIEI